MKRLHSEISSKKDLRITPVEYLQCEICGKRCYNFKLCNQPYTYCSKDCLEILILSQKNDYLDVKNRDNFSKQENEEK